MHYFVKLFFAYNQSLTFRKKRSSFLVFEMCIKMQNYRTVFPLHFSTLKCALLPLFTHKSFAHKTFQTLATFSLHSAEFLYFWSSFCRFLEYSNPLAMPCWELLVRFSNLSYFLFTCLPQKMPCKMQPFNFPRFKCKFFSTKGT